MPHNLCAVKWFGCFTLAVLAHMVAAAIPAHAAEPPALTTLDSPDAARDAQQAWAAYLDKPVEFTNSAGVPFVLVPAGRFTMGCGDDDAPLHQVTITRPFYLARTEVTQRQWQQVMNIRRSTYFEGPEQPVNFITWYDVDAFCKTIAKAESESKAVYRLPTEAEWEFAARAGVTTDATEAKLVEAAWTWENAEQTTHPVGLKAANPFGLFDMQGNVWEWCSDYYEPDYYTVAPATDPTGPATSLYGYRVLRGGSVFYPARAARFGNRAFYQSSRSERTIGFRPVLEIAMPTTGGEL